MDSRMLDLIVGRLRCAAAPPADAELLRAVAGHKDSAAFAEVVRRHGPMVLGVCRRVLRENADADDAFQATFFILFRKAGNLKEPDRLAGWLHQVAFRTARKLRTIRATRRGRETELFDVPAGEPPAEFVWREMRPIFDEELSRLPDKLRLPAVLCFLEGLSKAEAARVLGWPEGTLSGRLQRARERLRSRFTIRGLTLSTGTLAVALFDAVESAAVSESLLESTILNSTIGPATSHGVRVLAEGVIQAMFLTKLKAAVAVVALAGVVGTGTGWLLTPGGGSGQVIAGQPAKDAPKTPPLIGGHDSSKKEDKTSKLTERDILQAGLEVLKDRLSWQERMVKKGYLAESETLKTKADIIKVEAKLAELAGAKERDPRREADEALKKIEREVLEDTIKQLERAVKLTEDAVKKGVASETDLISARVKLNEYKLKLLQLGDPPAVTRKSPDTAELSAADLRKLTIDHKAKELARAELLFKEKAVSAEEVRRLRIEVAQLRAAAAEAEGDYATARKQRDDLLAELRDHASAVRKLVEQGVAPKTEQRALEIAVIEAIIECSNAEVRKLLADIVKMREDELREAEALYNTKAISTEELRKAERALSQAKARLAAGR